MSNTSSHQATKKQSTVTVDSFQVGGVIGTDGRIVKRIARDAGAGCRIRHQGNGVFLIEAWTNAALAVAKRWVLQAAEKSERKQYATTKTAREVQGRAANARTGAFAALDSSDDEEEDEVEEEDEAKKPETTGKADRSIKIDAMSLGFVDEGAGRFRRHQGWVTRQLWLGNEVEKSHEVHPSLAMHLKRLEIQERRLQEMTAEKGVDFSSEFPSLGGTVAKSRGAWGTDAGLARVMSEEVHIEKQMTETHVMEDLTGIIVDLPTPGLLRSVSCGGKKLAAITNGMAALVDDWDFDDEGWNTTEMPTGNGYDEAQWA